MRSVFFGRPLNLLVFKYNNLIIDAKMTQMSFWTSLRLNTYFGRLTLEAKDVVDKPIAFILSKS
jgi:hypothetical protein